MSTVRGRAAVSQPPPQAPKARPLSPSNVAWLATGYAVLLFLVIYAADPWHPGARYAKGWYELEHDQGQYYLMAEAIHQGNLGPFQYPVIYPFLGFLGSFFSPHDPFLIPDLLLFAVFAYFSTRFLSCILPNTALSLAASAFAIHATISMFVKPWTSTVSASCVAVLVYLYLAGRWSVVSGAISGLCVALIFGARVGDAIPGMVVLGLIAWELLRRRNGVGFLVSASATALSIGGLILAINHKFSGQWLGNYYTAAISQPWCFACIPWKLYGYVIDPYRFQGAANLLSIPMVQVLPLILVAPLGLIFLFAKPEKRRAAMAICAVLAGWALLYAPFHFVIGSTLKYGSMHYAKMIFPMLTACAFWALAVIAQPRDRERRVAILYAGALATVLLAIAAVTPHKIDLSEVTVSSGWNPESVWEAVDGNPSSRWDSGIPQQPGMTFDIDLHKTILVNRIDLDTTRSPGDFPRGLDVQVSTNGKNWHSVFATLGSDKQAEGNYYINPARARQIRLRLTAGDTSARWSIHELSIYGWQL